MDIIYIILTVLLVIILIILAIYNKLIRLLNKVKKAKANIEIYSNKRFDLIPSLVECVKSYSKHEGTTLKDIVSLRNNYNSSNHSNILEVGAMNDELNKYLAIVENYPNLKADTQYLNLQTQLANIERELQYARHTYNDEVTQYNILIESVPSNIVASIFNFRKANLFQIEEHKKEHIKIEL